MSKTSTPGTGPRVSTITPRGATITRATLSPSKNGSFAGDKSQAQDNSHRVTTAPEPDRPSGFHMVRDSGEKTPRERAFAAWNSSAKERLAGAQDRAFFPTPLERGTQAEIAKGDSYSGSANTVSKPNRQAQ